MNTDLRNLVNDGMPSTESVDRFMAEHIFPLVEGSDVTFVYRGKADGVNLRRWIYGLSAEQPLQQLGDSDLWTVTMELPEESRIEYKFEIVKGDSRELIVDPSNPVLARDPFGANSVCRGSGYVRPEWTMHDPDARAGSIQQWEIDSRAFGNRRAVNVYLPARFRWSRRYPLLIVHDGDDYMQFSDLKIVLDNLIHRLEIPAMIVALTRADDRLTEYAGNDSHARFIAEELLTMMNDKLPLIDTPRSRCLMGASFGGVASLHTAWRYPGIFNRLLLQSGSFAFSDIGRHQRGEVFDPVVNFVNAFRQQPGLPSRKIYLSCGVYESLIYENRSMVPLLQAHGMRVRYEEVRDAHNWENWRDRLRNGLSWLFPGPSWMVYE